MTVPQIRATIIFVIITSTIGGLQIFDEVRAFDAQGLGGADRQWMTTVLYLYDVAWGNQKNFGRAAAIAWILFIVILLIGLVNFAITRSISTSGPSTKVPRRAQRARRKAAAAAVRAQNASGRPSGAPARSTSAPTGAPNERKKR